MEIDIQSIYQLYGEAMIELALLRRENAALKGQLNAPPADNVTPVTPLKEVKDKP